MAARYLDGAGAGLSLACLAHCLAAPIAAAIFPQIVAPDGPEWIHLAFLVAAYPVAGWALVAGFRRHRSARPLALGAAGLALMTGGWLLEERFAETALTLMGVASLLAAHLTNWRLRRAWRDGAAVQLQPPALSIPAAE